MDKIEDLKSQIEYLKIIRDGKPNFLKKIIEKNLKEKIKELKSYKKEVKE